MADDMDSVNVDTDSALVPLQAGASAGFLPPVVVPVAGAVHSLDGMLGPDIVFSTGAAAKGLAVAKSSVANVTTFSIIGVTTALKESSGPTTLDIGAVADGEFLKRSGATIIGGTPAGGSTADFANQFMLMGG